MVSSGVWAEEIPIDRAYNLQEVGEGTATMKSELERIGYLGSIPASYRSMPMAAHFELQYVTSRLIFINSFWFVSRVKSCYSRDMLQLLKTLTYRSNHKLTLLQY